MNRQDLTAVMYRSQAVQRMDSSELDRLLVAARAFNEMVEVSGVLLHHRGVFLQYFEGPPEAIGQVYARIQRSHLHCELAELMHRPIVKRQFASWHMGFSEAPASVLEEIANESLQRALPSVRDRTDSSPGMQLLLDFWDWANRPTSA